MSPQQSLSSVSADFLVSDQGKTLLPELLPLQQVIENNSGHKNQTTFDHTVKVMRGLETVLRGEFLGAADQAVLQAYLHQRLASQTRGDLLRLLVITHDIMKPVVCVKNADGTTSFPGHEVLAAGRVPEFQARFGLELAEIQWVQQLVRLHGDPHGLLTAALALPDRQAQIIADFAAGVGDGAIELIVMVYADLLGGDLDTLNAADFKARTELCQAWLTRLIRNIA